MSDPITVDIPHKLGGAAARAKLESGAGQLGGIIPGGSVKSYHWEGDKLIFDIGAFGQRISVAIEVLETRLHVVIEAPPSISLFAGKIREKLQGLGTKLLR
jgi:hypothetical protein